MAVLMHKQVGKAAMDMSLLLCILLLLWRFPSGVRGTGGTMGPVACLVDSTTGILTTVCALKSSTMIPVCMGTLPAGTPMTQPMWALTAGEEFICGLKYDSHTPICWGSDVNVISIPVTYASTSYSTINAGRAHVCAVRDNRTLSLGTVDCWGENSYKQSVPPPNVPMLSVSAGEYYTCGISLDTKKVLCWGNLDNMVMPSPPSNGQFKALFSARTVMCGIRVDGNTECWSGSPPTYANPYPTTPFTTMAGAYFYICAVQQSNHRMICWSPSDLAPTPMPYAISALSASANLRITANGTSGEQDGYICAVREDIEVGNLYCFGRSPHTLNNALSSFSASKGICRDQCLEGQYPVLIDGQCPNPDHKVCLDCQGACPSGPPPTSVPSPPSPNISSTAPPGMSVIPVPSPSPGSKIVVPISIAVGCFLLAAVSLIAFLIVRRYPGIGGQSSQQEDSAFIIFTPQQICMATNNYETIIGRGGFGMVYKGVLPDNRIVAIKKPLKPGGGGDYKAEFEMLTRLNHPSLVNLIGYCKKNNVLVFPCMENGSLRDRMMDPICRKKLSDTKLRLNIAVQVAKGLQYIHQSAVIHRDVKSANILLDASWNAYITDFGISRFIPAGDATHCTTRVVGTPPYLDPDYYISGELTYKSDVYSFGVVLLELASGLSPIGLAENARSLHAKGRVSELVDKNLLKYYRECRLNLVQIAMFCVVPFRADRPTMEEVLKQLEMLWSGLNAGLPTDQFLSIKHGP